MKTTSRFVAGRFVSQLVIVATILVAGPALANESPVAPSPIARAVPRGAMAIRPPEGTPLPTAPTSPTSPTAPGARLVYHGGKVISNVKVYQVLWGPNVWTKTVTDMAAFYTAVTNSEYFDWLGSQYDTVGRKSVLDGHTTSNQNIGRGTFGGTIKITPSLTSTRITNDQIAAELAHQISLGVLPQPDVDRAGNVNALYMFDFPPGMSISLDGSQSCVTWYAYHYTTMIGGKSVPYGVHPDFSRDCANANFTLSTSVHSHELIEAVTDMEVGVDNIAWNSDVDGGQEIGDLCNTEGTIGGFTVQKMYSNHDGGCMLASAFRLPLCTQTVQQPNCRPCAAIDNGVACNGATPLCETDHASIKGGQCVACVADTTCSGATPVCDKSTGANADTCRACASDADCKDPTAPACVTGASDPKKGQCVGCTTNASCKAPKPACDTASETCVECIASSDCKDASKPVCTNHACVGRDGRPPASDGGVQPGGGDAGAPNGETPADASSADSGCACSTIARSSPASAGVGAGLFLALAIVARRRRRG